MTGDSSDLSGLVSTLRRYFENDATRDEVRSAVNDACLVMHSGGLAPQTILVALKAAVESATFEARTVVTRDAHRAITSELTPWMIDVCFSSSGRRYRSERGL